MMFTVLIPFAADAAFIDGDSAEAIALSVHSAQAKGLATILPSAIRDFSLQYHKGTPVFYAATFTTGGFALISADDAAGPVLAFSPDADFPIPIVSPAVKAWLEHLSEQILYVVENGNSGGMLQSKKPLADPSAACLANVQKQVSPLLAGITWDQGIYYNHLCPQDADAMTGYDGRVPVGCTAVAMGQVMKFHNHPAVGNGKHSYDTRKYGKLSADFGATAYDWSKMSGKLTDYDDNVARILFHAGVSADMVYGPYESGAYVSYPAGSYDARRAFPRFFRYKNNITARNKDETPDWDALLAAQLDEKSPLVYQGEGKNGGSGHAFVCDGYLYCTDNGNNVKYYDFNWGWGGYYNGWFLLDAMNPGPKSDYSFKQSALFGISPLESGQDCDQGPCCTGNKFAGTSTVCDPNAQQLRCLAGTLFCGTDVQKRTGTQYCSGDSPLCDGQFTWNEWQTLKTCPSDQQCYEDGSKTDCYACETGCKDGKCCACSSGECCDGCSFLDGYNTCGSIQTEYGCGEGCGAELQYRKGKRACNGKSADCKGDVNWGDWQRESVCDATQYCLVRGGTASCTLCKTGCVDGGCNDPVPGGGGCGCTAVGL